MDCLTHEYEEKMSCPETSVLNKPSTSRFRNIPEERKLHTRRGGGLKSRTLLYLFMFCLSKLYLPSEKLNNNQWRRDVEESGRVLIWSTVHVCAWSD